MKQLIDKSSYLEPWLSVEEISAHLGVSKESIYRWLEKKRIPAHRIGKLWKFKPSEVDSWIISGSASDVDNTAQPQVLGV